MQVNSGIQIHIVASEYNQELPPTIVFGFAGAEFSQAVYLTAPVDAAEAVRNADLLYKGYLEACGKAVSVWKEQGGALSKTAE